MNIPDALENKIAVTFYKDPGFKGQCRTDVEDIEDMTDAYSWLSIRISSVKISEFKGAIVYSAASYKSKSEYFGADDPILNNNCIGNDDVASVKVATGYWAILYKDENYNGETSGICTDVTGKKICIKDEVPDLKGLGGKISSIRIIAAPATPTPTPTNTPTPTPTPTMTPTPTSIPAP